MLVGIVVRACSRHSSGFWFLICYADTQLAFQVQQECGIQVVRSNKVVRRIPTESNGTPAMELGNIKVVLKWCTCMLVVNL